MKILMILLFTPIFGMSQFIDLNEDGKLDTIWYTNELPKYIGWNFVGLYKNSDSTLNITMDNTFIVDRGIFFANSDWVLSERDKEIAIKGINFSTRKPFLIYPSWGPKAKWYYSRKYAYDGTPLSVILDDYRIFTMKNRIDSIVVTVNPVLMDSLTLAPELSFEHQYFENIMKDLKYCAVFIYDQKSVFKTKPTYYTFNNDTFVVLRRYIAKLKSGKYELLFFPSMVCDPINLEMYKNRYLIFSIEDCWYKKHCFIFDIETNRYTAIYNSTYENKSFRGFHIEDIIKILKNPPKKRYGGEINDKPIKK